MKLRNKNLINCPQKVFYFLNRKSLVTINTFLVSAKKKVDFLSYCALHHYKILVISTNIFPVLGKFENCIVFAHFCNLMLKMKATVRNLRHNSIISFHFKDFQDASTFFQKKRKTKIPQ